MPRQRLSIATAAGFPDGSFRHADLRGALTNDDRPPKP